MDGSEGVVAFNPCRARAVSKGLLDESASLLQPPSAFLLLMRVVTSTDTSTPARERLIILLDRKSVEDADWELNRADKQREYNLPGAHFPKNFHKNLS